MNIPMRKLATVALFFAVASLGQASASAAIPQMRFSIRPDPQGSLSKGADYFVIDSEPGTVVRDTLQLSNPGGGPVRVRLRPVDAMSAQLGGVDYSPATGAPERAGAWIDLDRSSVTIAGGDVELVHFEVSVPEDARPGVNLGGIAAWTPPTGAEERKDAGLDASVSVQTRRVVAVQVNLPGSTVPEVVISEVTAIGRPDGIYLQVTIRNDGHGFAAGEGALRLGEGEDAISTSFTLDKVVPGTVVWYPIRWRDVAPADGSYPATVEIDYGAGVARWQGDVVVGAAVREALGDRGIAAEPGSRVALLAALTAVVAISVAMRWRTKRRRRRTTDTPAASPSPAPGPPPAAPEPVVPRTSAPPPPPPPLLRQAPAEPVAAEAQFRPR